MSPTLKKALSAILVAVVGAVLVGIQQQLVPLAPVAVQATLVALIVGLAHYVNAWGTEGKLLNKSKPKAPSVPGALGVMFLMCLVASAAVSVTSLGACGFITSKLPNLAKCAPTPTALATQVAAVLVAGGDYVHAFELLAEQDGETAVLCAVHAFLGTPGAQGVGATVSPAATRARAYLLLKGES